MFDFAALVIVALCFGAAGQPAEAAVAAAARAAAADARVAAAKAEKAAADAKAFAAKAVAAAAAATATAAAATKEAAAGEQAAATVEEAAAAKKVEGGAPQEAAPAVAVANPAEAAGLRRAATETEADQGGGIQGEGQGEGDGGGEEAGAGGSEGVNRPPALFVFGDSTVDAGNNNFLGTNLKANTFPFGIDFQPESGRFSNGKTMVDFLAKEMDIRAPPPFLRPEKNTYFGVNFASGGAGALNTTNEGQTISLLSQVDNFLSHVKDNNVSTDLLHKSLFVFSVGLDDYLPYGTTESPNAADAANPMRSDDVVANIASAVQAVIDAGAHKVAVVNILPLGCLPAVRYLLNPKPDQASADPPGDDNEDALDGLESSDEIAAEAAAAAKECDASANATAAEHNRVLNMLLQTRFPKPSTKEAAAMGPLVVSVNLYNIISDVILAPHLLGFGPHHMTACCGAVRPTNGALPCGTSRVIDGQQYNSSICQTRGKRIFWDYLHMSQHTAKVAADYAWGGSSRYAEPVNLKQLVDMP